MLVVQFPVDQWNCFIHVYWMINQHTHNYRLYSYQLLTLHLGGSIASLQGKHFAQEHNTLVVVALSGGTRIFLWGGGASRGQNVILRGQKSKNLTKMADFFLWLGGKWGGKSLWLGEKMPPIPPLDAATGILALKRSSLLKLTTFALWGGGAL